MAQFVIVAPIWGLKGDEGTRIELGPEARLFGTPGSRWSWDVSECNRRVVQCKKRAVMNSQASATEKLQELLKLFEPIEVMPTELISEAKADEAFCGALECLAGEWYGSVLDYIPDDDLPSLQTDFRYLATILEAYGFASPKITYDQPFHPVSRDILCFDGRPFNGRDSFLSDAAYAVRTESQDRARESVEEFLGRYRLFQGGRIIAPFYFVFAEDGAGEAVWPDANDRQRELRRGRQDMPVPADLASWWTWFSECLDAASRSSHFRHLSRAVRYFHNSCTESSEPRARNVELVKCLEALCGTSRIKDGERKATLEKRVKNLLVDWQHPDTEAFRQCYKIRCATVHDGEEDEQPLCGFEKAFDRTQDMARKIIKFQMVLAWIEVNRPDDLKHIHAALGEWFDNLDTMKKLTQLVSSVTQDRPGRVT